MQTLEDEKTIFFFWCSPERSARLLVLPTMSRHVRVTCTLLLCISFFLPGAQAGVSHQRARAGDVGYFSGSEFDVQELDARESGSGQTPLMAASLAGQHLVVEALLALGADYSIPEKDGYTPPHGVAFQGRPEAASVLIQHDIRVDEAHQDGYTPLHRTVWGGKSNHIETAKILVQDGAVDADALDAAGFTAAHHAAERSWDEMVQALLHVGADPNIQTRQHGDTLLHLAVKSQKPKMVRAVLVAGGDDTVKNAKQLTAHDLAEQMPSAEVRALFLQSKESAKGEASNAPDEL